MQAVFGLQALKKAVVGHNLHQASLLTTKDYAIVLS